LGEAWNPVNNAQRFVEKGGGRMYLNIAVRNWRPCRSHLISLYLTI